jgi:hypothetical protein
MAKASKEKELTSQDVEKVIEDYDKGYVEPKTPEEVAFQKGSVEGYDPNRLENPHATPMTQQEAEDVVKKYEGTTYIETPNELLRAQQVLSKTESK